MNIPDFIMRTIQAGENTVTVKGCEVGVKDTQFKKKFVLVCMGDQAFALTPKQAREVAYALTMTCTEMDE